MLPPPPGQRGKAGHPQPGAEEEKTSFTLGTWVWENVAFCFSGHEEFFLNRRGGCTVKQLPPDTGVAPKDGEQSSALGHSG